MKEKLIALIQEAMKARIPGREGEWEVVTGEDGGCPDWANDRCWHASIKTGYMEGRGPTENAALADLLRMILWYS